MIKTTFIFFGLVSSAILPLDIPLIPETVGKLSTNLIMKISSIKDVIKKNICILFEGPNRVQKVIVRVNLTT